MLNLETGVTKAAVEVVVTLAKAKLTTREFAHLAVGDIILTEQTPQTGAEVLVEGCPLFTAYPGVMKGHKAVRMGEPIVKSRELIERKLGQQSKG